jgi:hypothetical protein
MVFKPGQSGNPEGRRAGSRLNRNMGDRLYVRAMQNENDPLEFLTAVMTSPAANPTLRVHAAAILMPFKYSRSTVRPISKSVEIPVPTTIEQANENIATIGALAAAKYIGLDEANDLIGYQKAYIEARATTDIEERLVAVENALRERAPIVEVTVDSDLPALPGTSIEMPKTLTAASDNMPKGVERDANPWSALPDRDKPGQ